MLPHYARHATDCSHQPNPLQTRLVRHAMERKVWKAGLFRAIKLGNLADVEQMLAAGASVNDYSPDELGPAIVFATGIGHVDIVMALVRSGADIESTLAAAGDTIPLQLVSSLFSGFKALHTAAHNGHADMVSVLLQLGANPNSTDNQGATPLMRACRAGDGTSTVSTILRSLLEAGAEPTLEDERGGLAIHFAAARCDTQVVEVLLSKAPSTLNHKDHGGKTPLAVAAQECRDSTMSLLLSVGASDWWAALGFAMQLGKESSVRFLLKNGLEADGEKVATVSLKLLTSVSHSARILWTFC